MAGESNGRNIIADGGHGRGLMQIDDRSFGDWLAAHQDGLDPASNIDKGCSILRANIDHFGGNVRSGVSAYNAGQGGAQRGITNFGDSDRFTTGGNYSTKVFARAAEFRST